MTKRQSDRAAHKSRRQHRSRRQSARRSPEAIVCRPARRSLAPPSEPRTPVPCPFQPAPVAMVWPHTLYKRTTEGAAKGRICGTAPPLERGLLLFPLSDPIDCNMDQSTIPNVENPPNNAGLGT